MTDSDAHQRLAVAGKLLVLAYRRLQAREKENGRSVGGGAAAKVSKGGQSHAELHDTP